MLQDATKPRTKLRTLGAAFKWQVLYKPIAVSLQDKIQRSRCMLDTEFLTSIWYVASKSLYNKP